MAALPIGSVTFLFNNRGSTCASRRLIWVTFGDGARIDAQGSAFLVVSSMHEVHFVLKEAVSHGTRP